MSGTLAASLAVASLAINTPTRVAAGDFGKGLAVGAGIAIIANEINKASKGKKKKTKSSKKYVAAPKATIGTFKTTKAEVRDYQMRLNRLGYDTGYPDGVVGKNTRTGVRMFQARLQQEETGTLTPEQAAELKRLTDPEGATKQATTTEQGVLASSNVTVVKPQQEEPAKEDVLIVDNAIPIPPSLQNTIATEEVSLLSAGSSASTLEVFVLDETAEIPSNASSPNKFDILEVRPGDSMEAATHALTRQGATGCQSVGDTVLCSMPSDASDQIALRAVRDSAGVSRVAAVARHLHFPVPHLEAQMASALEESYSGLLSADRHTVGAPGCADVVGHDSYSGGEIYEASVQSDMSVLGQLAAQCGSFARLTMEGPEAGQVSDVYIVLFDGANIPLTKKPASLAKIKF